MAMQEQTTQVLQLYTAYFNRVADSAGVDYWLNEMTNNGWSVNEVAVTFSQQVEYTNLYAGLSYAQIVAQVYTNVLNRTADVAGAAYWESELSNGTIGVSQLVQAVINAAIEKDQNGDFKNFNDATLFNNKIEVSEFAYIVGSNETHLSLANITTQSSTVTDAKSQINPEPNDEKSMATPITLDDAIAGINGSVNITDITDDVDWYKITLDQPGTYTVYMETLAGTTIATAEDAYLVVTDSYGTNLLNLWDHASLTSNGEWLRDTFVANAAGDYYINVQRYDNLDTVYNFSLEIA